MNRIYALYSKIKLFGCSANDRYDESKRIVISNQIMMAYFFCLVPYIFIFWWMDSKLLSLITAGLSAIIILCLFINKSRYFLISRSLFILDITLPVYFFAAILGPETGIQFVSFMTMAIGFIIFGNNQSKVKWLFIFLNVVIFLGLEISEYAFFYKESFTAANYKYFRYTVIVNVFLLILAVLTYYANISNHFRDALDDISKSHNLTQRESEIIHLLLSGKTNSEIAAALFIEVSTVKTHLNNIYKKKKVKNRTQLTRIMSTPINILKT